MSETLWGYILAHPLISLARSLLENGIMSTVNAHLTTRRCSLMGPW